MFTKTLTWISIGAIALLSFALYFPYIFIADLIGDFKVYKTARVLFASPQLYLVLLLVVLFLVMMDILYLILVRELDTPLYLMYLSLMKRRAISDQERSKAFDQIAHYLKTKLDKPTRTQD